MYKEIIICTIIIFFIVGLNQLTQKHLQYTVETMTQQLEDVRNEIIKKNSNFEQIKQKAQDIYKNWENLDDILAIYIEHDELEKVKTAIISIKSFIEMEDEAQSIDAIDRCEYILEHIKEREAISLDNIF